MKKFTKLAAAATIAAGVVTMGAVVYAQADGRGNGNGRMGNGMGSGGMGNGGRGSAGQVVTTPLDQAEATSLTHMVEEEKLAHDVYTTLSLRWPESVLSTIATSEERHESAIQRLLDRYDVADPTTARGVGEFTDPAFTALYANLVSQGQVSQAAAMDVGVQIERLDIADLGTALETTDHADISRVFTNLSNGSEHHLQAFQTAA